MQYDVFVVLIYSKIKTMVPKCTYIYNTYRRNKVNRNIERRKIILHFQKRDRDIETKKGKSEKERLREKIRVAYLTTWMAEFQRVTKDISIHLIK